MGNARSTGGKSNSLVFVGADGSDRHTLRSFRQRRMPFAAFALRAALGKFLGKPLMFAFITLAP